MFKKTILGAGVLGLAGLFLFGKDAVSYVRTGANSVRQAVKAEVPVEFEIERARNMVENLIPEIRRCMHVIAEQQVEIEDQQELIEERTAALDHQKSTILAMRKDLSAGGAMVAYAGKSYSVDDVKKDLNVRFDRFKTASETLEIDRRILAARESSLIANQQKLEGMLNSKRDLEVQLEQLEARLKALEAAQTVSQLAIDDSSLSRARKLIRDLNKQLEVKERILDAEGKFTGLISVEQEESVVPANLGDQIDAYFQDATASTPEEVPST